MTRRDLKTPEFLSKIARLAPLLLLLLGFSGCGEPAAPPGELQVGVFKWTHHPVIDDIGEGFISRLGDRTLEEGKEIRFIERNASGDSAQASQIARFLYERDLDLIFVVGLPAAQILKSTQGTTPIVFGGPPDPVGAGLVPSLKNHGTNLTGTRYLPPAARILEVFREVVPESELVAVLHNPGEANSMAVVEDFLAAAYATSIEVLDLPITSAAELEGVLRELRRREPDGLFLPTDNLVYSNLDRIMAASDSASIPVFNCTRLVVEKGALFSLATDYREVGGVSADVAARILLEDTPVSDVDVVEITRGRLYVSAEKASLFESLELQSYPIESVMP